MTTYAGMEGVNLHVYALFIIFINGELTTVLSQESHNATFITFGQDPRYRQYLDGSFNTVFIPEPQTGVPASGLAINWQLYGRQTGIVHLQIWKPLTPSGQYGLVGRNIFTVPYEGLHTVHIEPHNAITVYKGDVIGFYCPQRNVIAFDAWACSQPTLAFLAEPTAKQLRPGAAVYFRYYTNKTVRPCRQYSLRVTIDPTEIPSWKPKRPAPGPPPPTPPVPSSDDHTGLHIKLWVGLTVLCVSAICVVLFVMYCLRRHQSKQPVVPRDSNTHGTLCSESDPPPHPDNHPVTSLTENQNVYSDERSSTAQSTYEYAAIVGDNTHAPRALHVQSNNAMPSKQDTGGSQRSQVDNEYSYVEVRENLISNGNCNRESDHIYEDNWKDARQINEKVAPPVQGKVVAPPRYESGIYLDVLPEETDTPSTELGTRGCSQQSPYEDVTDIKAQ